jgi:hypothetical protein
MKILFVLFLSMLSSFPNLVHAQVNIGVKGGFTDARQEYGEVDLPENAQTHIKGYNFSALMYFSLGKNLNLVLEPGLTKRGAACIPGWNGGIAPVFEGDTKFLINYIELPVKLMMSKRLFQDRIEVFGKIGYGTSMIAKAMRQNISLQGIEDPFKTKIELSRFSILNRWDHGISAGLGFGINFPFGQIFLESEYYHGLRDAERFNKSQNRSFDFSLGYRMNVMKR